MKVSDRVFLICDVQSITGCAATRQIAMRLTRGGISLPADAD